MTDLFPKAMSFVWAADNDGQPFHMSANDPGGATSWGVTYQTWSGWQRLHGVTPSLALFRACQQSDFLSLYNSMFWNACRCGSMGAVGIQIFDAAVNCGPGNAVKFLQTVLDVEIDGQIGPITLRVAQQTDQNALARQLCAQREEFYSTRSGARYFERGWDARAERCRDLVLGMLGGTAAMSADGLMNLYNKE